MTTLITAAKETRIQANDIFFRPNDSNNKWIRFDEKENRG